MHSHVSYLTHQPFIMKYLDNGRRLVFVISAPGFY